MQLIGKIKSHKKYKTLSDEIVKKELNNVLNIKQLKGPLSKKQEKIIIKEVRKKLHRIYASYQTKKKRKREKLLEELESRLKHKIIDKSELEKIIYGLLSITLSTKERLPYYPFIYNEIFNITGIPKSIMDLGSGLNPLSFPFMNLKKLKYYAYDIDIDDIEFLNKYFKIMKPSGLIGKAFVLDITNEKIIEKIPKSDIILMLKIIDLIDEKKKKISRELIKQLFEKNKTKFMVISFSTKTLTRKPMHLKRRIGFEKMINVMNLKFNSFSIENEIFYVIKK